MTQWTPVEAGLPPPYEVVRVLAGNVCTAQRVCRPAHQADKGALGWRMHPESEYDGWLVVTHWAPLTQAYGSDA